MGNASWSLIAGMLLLPKSNQCRLKLPGAELLELCPHRGRLGRKEGAELPCLLLWKHLDSGFWQFLVSFLSSFFVFSFSFSPHIPSAAASPRESSQWHPRSFPVTDFPPITGEELSKAGTIFLEVFALSASVFILISCFQGWLLSSNSVGVATSSGTCDSGDV